ncbi:hypothetical protein JZU68_05200, partial [bacterium]|nr:hypothetical protein [bacterium]
MVDKKDSLNIVLTRLKEREKELQCIYEISEILNDSLLPIEKLLASLLKVIPIGWQYPGNCNVQISYENMIVQSEGFVETDWMQQADLVIDNNISGKIKICYSSNSQFLPEEQKLLQSISEMIGDSIFYRNLKTTINFLKGQSDFGKIPEAVNSILRSTNDMHWKWRMRMAITIAEKLDLVKFGITRIYLVGSAKDATSGPGSSLELLVHFHGTENQKQLLINWFEGWSLGLSEFNFAQTGYRVENLIDLHIINDDDFQQSNNYTSKVFSAERQAIL